MVPNKLAHPYCHLLERLVKFNSTASIGAWEALEWLLTTLEPGYYVHRGSYMNVTTPEQYPCATIVLPSFAKHAFVSIQQVKMFSF